jgi:nitrate reductase beta subunit
MKSAPRSDGAESRQVHRVSHLLGDLQERLDQSRRRRIRLVQQRRDQAWHRLSQGLGEPEALERRLASASQRQDRAAMGAKWRILAKIFANPDLPEIDDYYEPFDFDYEHLQTAPEMKASRPRGRARRSPASGWRRSSGVRTGRRFSAASSPSAPRTPTSKASRRRSTAQFENTFMMYLPRLCEHCLNPTCVAACPSGAIYKREEDGIVLIDQDKCRGWRMCVSACPYKKIYYNWSSGKSEKCIFCYPRIEAGQPTVCSETCVGRIRYLGVCSMTPTASRPRRARPTRRISIRRS